MTHHGASLDWDALSADEREAVEDALDAWEAGGTDKSKLSVFELCDDPKLTPFIEQRIGELERVSIFIDTDITNEESRPENIGPVRITEVISRGILCDVFRGRQHGTSRDVAVKVLHRSGNPGSAENAFRQEIEVLARLNHPGVAKLYFAGRTSDAGRSLPYFVMEYLPGPSLIDYATKQGFSIADRVDLFVEVCEALGSAHQAGVIHRDLKPSNILTTEDGRPRILDFGIAKLVKATDTVHSLYGIGTPGYVSPEQLENDVAQDTRSDIYSLGVVLYELISGMLPYTRPMESIADAANAVLNGELVDLRKRAPNCPRDLASIVHKCLRKDPRHRYQSVEMLLADLGRFKNGDAVGARSQSALESSWRFARKYWISTTLACAVFLAFSLGGLTAFVFWKRSEQARRLLSDELALRRRSAFNQVLANADRNWQASPDLVRGWLDDAATAQELPFSGFAARVQTHRTKRVVNEFKAHANAVRELAYSADNSKLVTADVSGIVHGWDLESGNRIWQRRFGPQNVRGCSTSPDGEVLLVTTSGGLSLLDLASGQTLAEQSTGFRDTVDASFSPNGTLVYARGDGNRISVWDSGLNDHQGLYVAPFKRVLLAAIDADANRMIAVSQNGEAVAWNLGDDNYQSLLKPQSRTFNDGSISADLSRLALGGPRGEFRIFDLNSQQAVLVDEENGERFDRIGFSADRQWLICVSRRRVLGRHAASDWSTKWTRFVDHNASCLQCAHSQDAYALGFEDGFVQHCRMSSEPLGTVIASDLPRPLHVSVNEQNNRAIVAGDFQLEIDTATGAIVRRFYGIDGPCLGICWHPDGTLDIATGKRRQLLRSSPGQSDWVSILNSKHSIQCLACDRARDRAVAGLGKGEIAVLDSRAGKLRHTFRAHDATVTALAVHVDSGMIASGAENGEAALWDKDHHLLGRWQPHQGRVTDLAFSADGKRLFSVSRDCSLGIFDISAFAPRSAVHLGVDRLHAVAVSSDGQTLAVGGDGCDILLCDAVTGEFQASLTGHDERVTDLQFSADGDSLYSVSLDGTFRCWRPETSTSN
ncbi:Serine/threonine-protein kinase PknB [Stieleria neptunia]|uniref:Serine/threonine-protein kinase PknB n=1 Tax=Stieleria neptunia TaxID=2527979 RepID=A0A518I4G3_9BACT|nr:serine/threonine-protein kinase [Stieleria neptunia]QDV47956.1 Serine/threonine-protein kinase PknB [Stieleria neptunia]